MRRAYAKPGSPSGGSGFEDAGYDDVARSADGRRMADVTQCSMLLR